MKKIYLHIGTFKTGTTALQFHMHQNRERLFKNGFYYGDYFGNYYVHSNLCYGLLEEALTAYGLFDKYKKHPRFLNVAEKPDDVIEKIEKNAVNSTNIIISSEALFADAFRTLVGLHAELSDQQTNDINTYMRKRLKELLFLISDQIVIVCYLRRQDLYIEAQYNQYCKNTWYGDRNQRLPEFKEFVNCHPIELNYFTVLENWRKIFDTAEFKIIPYEKKSFRKDLITDFYTDVLKIDFEEIRHFENIGYNQGNHRLDRDILEYKKYLKLDNDRINQLLIQYCQERGEVKDYAYFSKSDRMNFMNEFNGQNEKVAKNYLHRKDGQLFCDMDYDIISYQGLKIETVYEITRWMFKKLL